MAGILDEIRKDQNPRSSCRMCTYIEGQSKADQAEWDQAFAENLTLTSIHRALQKRNAPVGKSSVEGHSSNKHRR